LIGKRKHQNYWNYAEVYKSFDKVLSAWMFVASACLEKTYKLPYGKLKG